MATPGSASSAAMEVESGSGSNSRKRQHVEQAQAEAQRLQEERVKTLDAGQVNLLAAITGELDIKLTPVTEKITVLQEDMQKVKTTQVKQEATIKQNTRPSWRLSRNVWRQWRRARLSVPVPVSVTGSLQFLQVPHLLPH